MFAALLLATEDESAILFLGVAKAKAVPNAGNANGATAAFTVIPTHPSHLRNLSMEAARAPATKQERQLASRVPIAPEVLYDLDRCIALFEADELQTWESFQMLAADLRIRDIFKTGRCGRKPTPTETPAEYTELLLEPVVRRVVDNQKSFGARLGALFLLLALHELQSSRPRVPVPVILDDQWPGFEKLLGEVRSLRHADGFRAIHALWHGGKLSLRYCNGGQNAKTSGHTTNAIDQELDRRVERKATLMPAQESNATLGPCPYALHLRDTGLAALDVLEAQYAKALQAAMAHEEEGPTGGNGGNGGGGGGGSGDGGGNSGDYVATTRVAADLGTELGYYTSGIWPRRAPAEKAGPRRLGEASPTKRGGSTRASTTLLDPTGVADHFFRRGEKRAAPYQPQKRKRL